MTKEEWFIGLTPDIGTSEAMQCALDWWHNLPIQDLQGHHGWANLCMIYYPDKTECYHLTSDEVQYIYEQEKINKI